MPQSDLQALAAELSTPSEKLSRLLLHNAAMASGELFHSNMLAFLIEVTRPATGDHEVLRSLLQRCGCHAWPTAADCLGLARPTIGQLREAAEREVSKRRLSPDQLIDLEAFGEKLRDREPSESLYRLTQRESGNIDLLINLHEHGAGRVRTRKRRAGKGTLAREGLDAFIFTLQNEKPYRLAIENKVKSIATRRQLADYLRELAQLPGQSRLVLLTLFPYGGSGSSSADVPLAILTYREFAEWLRSVSNLLCVQQNAPWISDYIAYIDALVSISDRVWGCILAAEQTSTPMTNLDRLVARPLARCRMLASYQKLRASRMAYMLEQRLDGPLPIKSIRRGDPWPTSPHLEVYSGYSNQTGMFGAVLVKPRKVGHLEVLEAVGAQYQNGEYRPYVSWDWVAGPSSKKSGPSIVVEPLTVGHVQPADLVNARAEELRVLLTDGGSQWRARAYDHRWRGFVRVIDDPPTALLDRMARDIRRWATELGQTERESSS